MGFDWRHLVTIVLVSCALMFLVWLIASMVLLPLGASQWANRVKHNADRRHDIRDYSREVNRWNGAGAGSRAVYAGQTWEVAEQENGTFVTAGASTNENQDCEWHYQDGDSYCSFSPSKLDNEAPTYTPLRYFATGPLTQPLNGTLEYNVTRNLTLRWTNSTGGGEQLTYTVPLALFHRQSRTRFTPVQSVCVIVRQATATSAPEIAVDSDKEGGCPIYSENEKAKRRRVVYRGDYNSSELLAPVFRVELRSFQDPWIEAVEQFSNEEDGFKWTDHRTYVPGIVLTAVGTPPFVLLFCGCLLLCVWICIGETKWVQNLLDKLEMHGDGDAEELRDSGSDDDTATNLDTDAAVTSASASHGDDTEMQKKPSKKSRSKDRTPHAEPAAAAAASSGAAGRTSTSSSSGSTTRD